jgi:Domain of unknown function (DUF1877)
MGMVATFQQVHPATLSELIRKPGLLEEFLFPGDDSYAYDGYGDLTVDISKSSMAAWEEIRRRTLGLSGEVKLADGATASVRRIEIERDVTTWRQPDTGEPEQRAHAKIAALRLMPPLRRRLYRAKQRVSDFTVSTLWLALLLSFVCLHLQKKYGLPPWSLAALIVAIVVVVLGKAVAIFRRERLVVTYRHRRSKAISRSRPEPMDIDKAWERIEAALPRVGGEEAEAVRKAISSGRDIEGSEVGYGPASYLTAEEVADVASSLSLVSAETFAEECDQDSREYVTTHLRNLQSYFREAAEHGHGMIRYYC